MPLDASIQRILIVGPGLLGGSIGLTLRAQGFAGKIVGFSRKATTLATAMQRGCIDVATSDLLPAAADCDLIVLATPVQTLCEMIRLLGGIDLQKTVITDVGSTKRSIVACAANHLKQPQMFVGSHPMAGSEQHGPAAADAKLFTGKPVVLTPTHETNERAITVVNSLWAALGMRVFRMTPDEHDHAVARISHLPHAASVLLMLLAGRGQTRSLDIASTGLKDVTRLAAGDAELWADIFFDNANAMKDTLGEFQSLIHEFQRLIDSRDRAGLVKLLDDAAKLRSDWLFSKDGMG